ncbi:hypothetical protein BGZ54_007873 [Gamsiella multidivaricata]|nr:hypothetical protein BGZ54_007873 [Gamsiella multidivaricata]
MTPHPFKTQIPLPMSPHHPIKDERKRLSEYGSSTFKPKGESTYQLYLNHPFTQQAQQLSPEPQQTYISKYAHYTAGSQNVDRARSICGMKPSTTMALSMIEDKKTAFQYPPSRRDSLVSPPPPPYFHSDHGVCAFTLDNKPSLSDPMITPASLAARKRNSLPFFSASTAASISNPAVVRTARELKRHSLPATGSASAGALQWPSAMTMTMAAVTRPKLARTVSPKPISIFYGSSGGEIGSPLAASTPTAIFTPHTSRLLEKSEVDTLYSYKISEDGCGSLRSTDSGIGADPQTRSAQHANLKWTGASAADKQGQFPGYWQDMKEHRMHYWIFGSFGAMAIGAVVWILMMPALLVWAAVVPGVAFAVLGAQYTGYRWRRRMHHKQQLKHHLPSATAVSSMRAASSVLLNSSSTSAPSSGLVPHHYQTNHAHRSSDGSMHTSVGSIGSDSFLEAHQSSPPHILKAQFQHQYFRSFGSPVCGSPSEFADGYHHQDGQESPTPASHPSWHSLQNHPTATLAGHSQTHSDVQRRARTMQRQESTSSIASSETVSSSSTSSEISSSTPVSVSTPWVHLGNSPVMPPPPAYVAKDCEEMGMMVDEASEAVPSDDKAVTLPEIAPVGDLFSEFAINFESMRF